MSGPPQSPGSNLPRVGMSPLSARPPSAGRRARPPSAGGLISNPNVIGALTTSNLAAASAVSAVSATPTPPSSHPHAAALSAQRAASRDEKRASLKKLAALVLAPLDSPSAAATAAASGGGSDTSRGDTSLSAVVQTLFPLTAADDHTYVSTLKADIYSLQLRIEKLQRTASAGSAAAAAKRAAAAANNALFADVAGVRHNTSDVDAIVAASARKPGRLKFRLLEFLMAAQIQLESLLTANSPAPAAASGGDGLTPPLSRLPSYLGVTDRLHESQETIRKLTKKLAVAETKLASAATAAPTATPASAATATAATPAPAPAPANDVLDLSLLSEVFEELDDQTRLLEAECGVLVSGAPPLSGAGDMKTVNALIERVRRSALQIEVAREKGVRMIQNEAEEAKQIARALGDNLEHLKDDSARRRTEFDAERGTTAAALKALQLKYSELESSKAELQKQYTGLEAKYSELNASLTAQQTANASAVATLTAKAESLQKELDSEYESRQSEGDAHATELSDVEKRFEKSNADMKAALQSAQTELANRNAKIATLEKSVTELTAANQTVQSRADEQRVAFELERTTRTAELAATEKRLALANERNQIIAQTVNVKLAPADVKSATPTPTLAAHKTDLMSALGASKSTETFITALSAPNTTAAGKPTEVVLYLTAALPAAGELNSVSALQRIITNLQSEVSLAKSAYDKSKRALEMLESINKELNDKRDFDFKALTHDHKLQRVKHDAERTRLADLETKQTAHVNKLQQTVTDLHERITRGSGALNNGDSKSDTAASTAAPPTVHDFQSIYRDEMRVMKGAFELKLELAREQEAIAKQHAAQKARLLNEALEEERRIYSQTVSKLRMDVEALQIAAAAKTDPASAKK